MIHTRHPHRAVLHVASLLTLSLCCSGAAGQSSSPATAVPPSDAAPTPLVTPVAPVISPAPTPLIEPSEILGRDRLPLGRSTVSATSSASPTTQPTSTTGSASTGWATGVGGGYVTQTVISLAMVLGLIFLLRWLMNRAKSGASAGGARKAGAVDVLARVAIAPRSHIAFLRLGHRVLVVGESSNGMTTLANIDDPDEIATILGAISSSSCGSVSGGFRSLLDKFGDRYDGSGTSLPDVGGDSVEARIDNARDRVSKLRAKLRASSEKTHRT